MGLQTPLLDHNEAPALSGPSDPSLEEESPLSRLIAESTPPSALLPFSQTAAGSTLDETTMTSTSSVASISRPASLTTTIAGTLICLQWGFTWGAYFSKHWMDSHLQISIGWQSRFLPWIDKHTDFVIDEQSVFTLADNLKDDKEYVSLAGLWICSVLLPCVFMIVCPIWILTDYSVPRRHQQHVSRSWLELSIRLSLLVSFIMLILDIAITGLEMSWADTDLQVHNELKGAYLAYLMGGTCGILVVVILRMPHLQHVRLLGYPHHQQHHKHKSSSSRHRQIINENTSTEAPPPPPARHAPPPNAFSLPWLSSRQNGGTAGDGANIHRTTSETEPLVAAQESSRPTQASLEQRQRNTSANTSIPTWKKFIVFQSGLLALLLWIPALALPQFRVLFDGLAGNLVKNNAFNVYLWEFPGIVWSTAMQSGTPKIIMIWIYSILGLLVIVIPWTAHLMAVLAWIFPRARLVLRDVLQLLHPAMCGIPLAAAVVATVPSFVDIGEDLDDDICTNIEKVIQNQCLVSGGVHLAGCWFFLAQALVLELFVVCTIQWTGPPNKTTTAVNIVV